MRIISAEERLGSDFGAKVMLLGESGIGAREPRIAEWLEQ